MSHGFMDECSQHFTLSLEFDKGELNRLIGRQGFPERFAFTGILHRFIDAEWAAPDRCSLANPA